MLNVSFALDSPTYFAGEVLNLRAFLNEGSNVELLGMSVQVLGRISFASKSYFNFGRLEEYFRPMVGISKSFSGSWCKDDSEKFAFILYLTKPAFLTAAQSVEDVFTWRGVLGEELPASFEGLLCQIEHSLCIQLMWKDSRHHVQKSNSRLPFKLLANPKHLCRASKLIPWPAPIEEVTLQVDDLDDLFPDDLDLESCSAATLSNVEKEVTRHQMLGATTSGFEEMIRDLCEMSGSYRGTIRLDDGLVLGSIELTRPTCIPGSQISVLIQINNAPSHSHSHSHSQTQIHNQQKLISLLAQFECVEEYSSEILSNSPAPQSTWTDGLRPVEMAPCGFDGKFTFLLALPPNLQTDFSCDLFNFKWQLKLQLKVQLGEVKSVEFTIPIKLISNRLILINR